MAQPDDDAQQTTTLARAGLWREAVAAYAEIVTKGGSSFAIHFNFGMALMHCGAWASRSDQMRAALQYSPGSLDALNNLASASNKLGNANAAEQASRRVMALDPRHYVGWTTLGLAINEQGRIVDGLPCIRKALDSAARYPP
ncbi:MAG: hypothetical protein WAS25_08560 [Geothrix sp.]|uniref:hypothetical protein n=1 Tax=Geothrix sp. TaxID=1962974 RepID=UPI003BB03E76